MPTSLQSIHNQLCYIILNNNSIINNITKQNYNKGENATNELVVK